MLGNLLIQDPGLTAGSTNQRDPYAKAVQFYQVNFKYRRYWSGNTIFEDNKPIQQLRNCPFCLDHIEHDERGYPHCLTCGTIFPLPDSIFPRTNESAARHKAANMRKFLRKIRADDNAKTGNRAGTETIPSSHHKLRSGQSPARKRVLRHCLP